MFCIGHAADGNLGASVTAFAVNAYSLGKYLKAVIGYLAVFLAIAMDLSLVVKLAKHKANYVLNLLIFLLVEALVLLKLGKAVKTVFLKNSVKLLCLLFKGRLNVIAVSHKCNVKSGVGAGDYKKLTGEKYVAAEKI